MADKWQAIHNFWNSFNIPAYDENSVPDDAQMPYITYSAVTSGFEDALVFQGNLWYFSTSWQEISNKADEIAQRLMPYVLIPIDKRQYLMLVRGQPFAQRMRDENDRVKRIFLNLMGEYFTKY